MHDHISKSEFVVGGALVFPANFFAPAKILLALTEGLLFRRVFQTENPEITH